jgi:GNAT superfamily N-acetyltransferase
MIAARIGKAGVSVMRQDVPFALADCKGREHRAIDEFMDNLIIREADEADLSFITGLIASDPVADQRDPPAPDDAEQQLAGFRAIAADPCHALYVAEASGEPVGSFQLSFIPVVARRGAWRAMIESVRVAPEYQGKGIGAEMMQWAVARAGEQGCALVQLMSDANRPEAHRFYERLGFVATHTGFKLKLR